MFMCVFTICLDNIQIGGSVYKVWVPLSVWDYKYKKPFKLLIFNISIIIIMLLIITVYYTKRQSVVVQVPDT